MQPRRTKEIKELVNFPRCIVYFCLHSLQKSHLPTQTRRDKAAWKKSPGAFDFSRAYAK
jgi:hypothetical protein